jgi:hypothetical protein
VEQNALKHGAGSVHTAPARLAWGNVLAELGRFSEAEAALLAAEAAFEQGTQPQRQIDAIDALILLYERWRAAEPGGGLDDRLAASQARRTALAAATRPATRGAPASP